MIICDEKNMLARLIVTWNKEQNPNCIREYQSSHAVSKVFNKY